MYLMKTRYIFAPFLALKAQVNMDGARKHVCRICGLDFEMTLR